MLPTCLTPAKLVLLLKVSSLQKFPTVCLTLGCLLGTMCGFQTALLWGGEIRGDHCYRQRQVVADSWLLIVWSYACSAMWAEWITTVLSNHGELICLPAYSNRSTFFLMEAASVQVNVLKFGLKFVVVLQSR